jgi:hypothetical protein
MAGNGEQCKVPETYTDILDFEELGAKPPENPNDPYFNIEKLREWERKKADNLTRYRFFSAIRFILLRDFGFPDKAEYIPIDAEEPISDPLRQLSDPERAQVLTIAGLLMADGYSDPLVGKTELQVRASPSGGDVVWSKGKPGGLPVPENFPDEVIIASLFVKRTLAAVQEFKLNASLFLEVYKLLRRDSTRAAEARFQTRQLAEIGRQLINERIHPDDPQFEPRYRRALSIALSGSTEGRKSAIDIDLPDLEEVAEADIIKDNVTALAAVYYSAMLEDLKFFQVMDKVVEQFIQGMLPVSRGRGGDALYEYMREAPRRISELERRGLYARAFGLAQGSVEEPLPNREYNDLWIRFLSAVSLNSRESLSTERRVTSSEQVFKSARDLAVNLSLHGYGLAHFAAVELQSVIRFILDALSSDDVRSAYGVRDIWQLIERVSNMYLGGAVNSVRQRTMATAGARIIEWLAGKAGHLSGPNRMLRVDPEIVSYAERWLAVTGTADQIVEKFSEPVALPSQRTIPDFSVGGIVPVPDAIRDALANVPGLPNMPQA